MPARLTPVAARINIEARRMNHTPAVDALNALARLLRVRPEVQQLCRFGAQWAADHPAMSDRWAPFHCVTHGACVIELSDLGRIIPLTSGDAVVLPHGARHVVRAATTPAGAQGPFAIRSRRVGAIEIKSNTDGEPETRLICGRLRFDRARDNLVHAALPDAIVVSAAADAPGASRMRMLMSAIQEEVEAERAGATAIATDLASALFVMVLRSHLDCTQGASGMLGLLAHRQLGRAMAAMLNDPGRNWTLDELAAHAHASRASLVRMFRRTAQRPPLAMLTELRLELARRKLCGADVPIAAVAAEVGYKSESSFSRAFHRRFGMRPGEARCDLSA
jgi:AraC family transcriptional activator of mtrCDE